LNNIDIRWNTILYVYTNHCYLKETVTTIYRDNTNNVCTVCETVVYTFATATQYQVLNEEWERENYSVLEIQNFNKK
jgi:hypothetical protein